MYMHASVRACVYTAGKEMEKKQKVLSRECSWEASLTDRVTFEPRLNEVRDKPLTQKSKGQAFQKEGTVNVRP